MADEHKQEDTPETPEQIPEPTVETPAEEKTEVTPEVHSEPDYKAIAEAEKARADAAEAALAEQAFKKRKARRQADPEPEPEAEEDLDLPEEDRPLTVGEYQRLSQKEKEAEAKKAREADALRIARENTTSEDEAQAAFQTWRARMRHSDDIKEDMLFVIQGLNGKKIRGHQREVQRAQGSDALAEPHAPAAQQDTQPAPEVKIAPNDLAALKATGFQWDGTSGLYKKPLDKRGKKFMTFDPKTRKRQVIG